MSANTVQSKRHRSKTIVVTAILIMALAYTMLPLYYLVIAATKNERDLATTFGLWLADDFSLWENVSGIFTYDGGIFLRWLTNTLWYSATSAVVATMLAAMAGYALAKFAFSGREAVFRIILGSVMIPQTALVIPLFLLMAKVGMINTPWAVIVPSMVFPLGVYLMRIYADEGIPNELIEAARIDGASELRIFFTVGCRLMAPGLVTVLLLSFVSSWNNYFLPLVVLNTPDSQTLTVGLTNWFAIAAGGQSSESLFTMIIAGALISLLPIIAAFLLLQRYWQSGITAGSGK